MRFVGSLAAEVDAARVVDERPDETLALQAKITDLDRRLAALTGHLASGLVPERAYVAARDQIGADRAVLVGELQGIRDRATLAWSAPEARSLLAEWDTLSLARRQAMLRRLVRRVTVWPGRDRRCEIVPAAGS